MKSCTFQEITLLSLRVDRLPFVPQLFISEKENDAQNVNPKLLLSIVTNNKEGQQRQEQKYNNCVSCLT